MKTIPVDQVNEKLAKALEQQNEHEPIGLTKDANTVAWVLRVPQELRNAEADVVLHLHHGPNGEFLISVQAKPSPAEPAHRRPIFGAGQGTLTILSEDDEHLKDFQEYIK
jgi:hypothetical protein